MLVLIVSCAVVLIIIGMFALNYNHIFQQNLVGKTASESAALQFVQDMGRVVVNVPDGTGQNGLPATTPMALVDQVPQDITDHGCSKPILGVNTRLSMVRVEMVAAAQLGNVAMLYAAKHDYDDLVKVKIPAFNKALQDVDSWKDAAGNPINAVAAAKAAFKENLRAGKSASQLVESSFSATIGFANNNSSVHTNALVPNSSADLAISQNLDKYTLRDDSGNRVYKAYVPVGVDTTGKQIYSGEGTFAYPAIPQQFEFSAIANAPSLVPNDSFQPVSGNAAVDPWAPAAMVQVTAKETMSDLGGDKQAGTMTETATAEVGGAMQNYPSGGLCVGFPDGLPGHTNMFNTVLSIMNWSQPHGTLAADTPSPFFGWNNNSVGHWFEAEGGAVGSTLNATKPNGNFKHVHTFKDRDEHDDPSIACSFVVYDWLKTVGPRVNLDSLASALEMGAGTANVASIQTNYLGNSVLVASAGDQSSRNIASNWLPAARAAGPSSTATAAGYTEAIGALPNAAFPGDRSPMNSLTGGHSDDGMQDPRFILNHGTAVDPQNRTAATQNKDQTALAYGDTSHGVVAPAAAINLLHDTDGTTTSASGAPFQEVKDYTKMLADTNNAAVNSAGHAKTALDDVRSNIGSDTSVITNDLSTIRSRLGLRQWQAQPSPSPLPTVPPPTQSQRDAYNRQVQAVNSFNSALGSLKADVDQIGQKNQDAIAQNGNSPSYSVSDAVAADAGAINAASADAIQKAQAIGFPTGEFQDIQSRASNSTASPPTDLVAQAAVMKRALYVKNNALYVNKVIIGINNNDKALSAQGLDKVENLHYKLAGQDLWAIALQASASVAQIEGTGPIPTYQGAGDPGAKDWLSPSTSLDGTKSNLIVYKYPGASPSPMPGVNIGLLVPPAYAASTTVPSSNRRMVIFGADPTGKVWTLVTSHTPYSQTSILDGQSVYQNTLAFGEDISNSDTTYWLAEARDEYANPGQGDYYADGVGNNGNVVDSGWCRSATYIGSSSPPDTVNGIQAACQHVAAEFRISCPITPSSCQQIQSVNLDGTAGAAAGNTCPPPPPCGS